MTKQKVEVKITIGDKEYTENEAREIYIKLHQLFDSKQYIYPTYPSYPSSPFEYPSVYGNTDARL